MLKTNSFSGGTNAATITTANSGGTSGDAFTSISGTPIYTTSQASGNRSPMVAQISSANSGTVGWDPVTLAARTIYVRAYVYITASPSAGGSFILCDSVSPGVNLYIDTSRRLSVRRTTGSTDFAKQTGSVPTNQWCRLEVKFVVGTTTSNGACEIRRYDSADSGTSSETTTGSAINLGTAVPTYALFTYSSNLTILYDDIGATDVDWLGSAVVTTYAPPPQRSTAYSTLLAR